MEVAAEAEINPNFGWTEKLLSFFSHELRMFYFCRVYNKRVGSSEELESCGYILQRVRSFYALLY